METDASSDHAQVCNSKFSVIHLSLPQGFVDEQRGVDRACFMDLPKLLSQLRSKVPKGRLVVLMATRDPSSALRSKANDHQRRSREASREMEAGRKLLLHWMRTDFGGHDHALHKGMISYEMLLMLGKDYLNVDGGFFDTLLGHRLSEAEMDRIELPHLRDGNFKYVKESFLERLWRGCIRLFAPRRTSAMLH